jgi:hypothetical protein
MSKVMGLPSTARCNSPYRYICFGLQTVQQHDVAQSADQMYSFRPQLIILPPLMVKHYKGVSNIHKSMAFAVLVEQLKSPMHTYEKLDE